MRIRLTTSFARGVMVACVLALCPGIARAQGVPGVALERQQGQAPAQGLQDSITDTVKRFNIGAYGGITLDPEMITIGAFGRFAPIFSPAVAFRPGLYLSFGEVTTEFGIDLDVIYTTRIQTQTTGGDRSTHLRLTDTSGFLAPRRLASTIAKPVAARSERLIEWRRSRPCG